MKRQALLLALLSALALTGCVVDTPDPHANRLEVQVPEGYVVYHSDGEPLLAHPDYIEHEWGDWVDC
jgi:hypothetical protein